MTRKKSQGFTLVEIVIVAVITALVAAVVIPQFKGSPDEAKKGTAEFNLGVVRSIVQTFRAQHGGVTPVLPNGATNLDALTKETNAAGTVTPGGGFGPYVIAMPENPFTGVKAVKAVTTPGTAPVASDVTAANAGGWIYDPSTGNLWLDSNTQGEFAW